MSDTRTDNPESTPPATSGVSTEAVKKPPKRGGFLGNLAFNIIIPVLILTRFAGEDSLGPTWSIIIALAFPVCYGLWDLHQSGKINPFSVLGVISVLLTGGISLLQLDPQYLAIKEAAIPGIIGVAVLLSQRTRFPLVKTLILNGQIIRTRALYEALDEQGNAQIFERRLSQASLIVAGSFFLSSVLNYVLTRTIVTSPPGTQAFSEELGRMTALSYPVIVVPSMIVLLFAIWFVFSRISKLTGQKLESFLVDPDNTED